MNRLHLMNAAGQLSPELESDMRAVLQSTLNREAERLSLDGVDVAVCCSPWTVAETGVHGYAPLAHWVQLSVTPEHPAFQANWRAELRGTLAHELHHCRRWQGPGYGTTFLEVLVTEGLAQHNELEERGGPPPYALAHIDLPELAARAEPLLDRADFGFAAWFYGSEAKGLPRWAGYALGYELVREYLSAQGGTAAQHVHAPAEAFRAAWASLTG